MHITDAKELILNENLKQPWKRRSVQALAAYSYLHQRARRVYFNDYPMRTVTNSPGIYRPKAWSRCPSEHTTLHWGLKCCLKYRSTEGLLKSLATSSPLIISPNYDRQMNVEWRATAVTSSLINNFSELNLQTNRELRHWNRPTNITNK